MVLQALTRKDASDRYVHCSAEELADAIKATGIGTITSCIRTLRKNATERLRKHLDIECRKHDFIAHDDQGYRLREWITVRDADEEAADGNGIMPGGDSWPCKKYCVSQQKWVFYVTLFLDRRLTHGCFFAITGRAARG